MPPNPQEKAHRRIQLIFGLVLGVLLYVELSRHDSTPVVSPRSAAVLAVPRIADDPFAKLIRDDPLSALIESRARHIREVKDYRLTMVKQEMLPSGMSSEQEMNVKFRQEPFSVVMHWVRNAGLANRLIYVEGRWTDSDAESVAESKLALCQPGAVVQLFKKSLKIPIHGALAKRTARRSVDEFGFKRTLDLLIKYCQIAQSRDELDLSLAGASYFDGRPVWVVRRRLPYTGDAGIYPDRTAVIFIDKKYRIPVAVYCYSDDKEEPEKLLGKYEYRNIVFNVGLSDADFDPQTYGM